MTLKRAGCTPPWVLQTTESLRNTQERLQLRLHAARLVCAMLQLCHTPFCALTVPLAAHTQVESAHVLSNVTCVLQRDALLADFASRVRAVQEAAKAADEERQEAVATLEDRATELVKHLQEQGAERTVLTRIGHELVAEDLDAPDDPQGIAQRLYEIAEC